MHNPVMQRRHLLLAGLATPFAALAPTAWAQSLSPAGAGKPIRLIVPYAAGGPIDVTARVLAQAEVKAKFAGVGAEVHSLGPTEFATFVKAENEKWAKLIRERKLQLD